MAQPEQLSLADVKNRLSEVVDNIERSHGRVVITKHGRPAVALVSIADLESLEETLEILSNPDLVEEIKKARAEITKGKARRLTKQQAQKLITRG